METLRERLTNILKDITYKPGWSFEVVPVDHRDRSPWRDQTTTILGTMLVPSTSDAKHPLIPVHRRMDLSEDATRRMTDGDLILVVISSLVRDMELHEMNEWLKYRGYNIRDPHPELKTPTDVTSLESFLRG